MISCSNESERATLKIPCTTLDSGTVSVRAFGIELEFETVLLDGVVGILALPIIVPSNVE